MLAAGTQIATGDCLAEAKLALQARLSSLPLREILESDRDGEHSRIVLELETLARFHSLVSGGGGPAIELMIIDGTGWSLEHGRWQPFAAAAATAESTAADEQALADQLTEGARADCLGTVEKNGRQVVGYELHLDGDQSSGDPYTTMQLYVDPRTRLPLNIDMTGLGDTGPTAGHETFEYDKSIKLAPPR